MKSPWLPPLYLEFETTTFRNEEKRVAVRVKKNGEVIQASEFFPAEATRVIALFKAAGIETDELKRGEPEMPGFIKWRRR